MLSCAPSERKVLLTLLSEAEAKAKPASKLLQRSSTDGGAEDGAPSSKRQKKGGADEEGAPRLKSSSEAVPGALTTASAVAIGEHGQLLCRLDAKGTMVGRIHMTEQADPGETVRMLTELPSRPLRVVVIGPREEGAGARGSGAGKAAASFELSIRPSLLAAPTAAPLAHSRVSFDSLTPVSAKHAHPVTGVPACPRHCLPFCCCCCVKSCLAKLVRTACARPCALGSSCCDDNEATGVCRKPHNKSSSTGLSATSHDVA